VSGRQQQSRIHEARWPHRDQTAKRQIRGCMRRRCEALSVALVEKGWETSTMWQCGDGGATVPSINIRLVPATGSSAAGRGDPRPITASRVRAEESLANRRKWPWCEGGRAYLRRGGRKKRCTRASGAGAKQSARPGTTARGYPVRCRRICRTAELAEKSCKGAAVPGKRWSALAA
jgi:hypothetical protein